MDFKTRNLFRSPHEGAAKGVLSSAEASGAALPLSAGLKIGSCEGESQAWMNSEASRIAPPRPEGSREGTAPGIQRDAATVVLESFTSLRRRAAKG